ncbi:molybdenum cofactor guanylyltransferase [Candidatus Bathyarchaeota archaeon]|nr:molybdenum cofactor guanylyltransferase [Candidatus Bathyarchaeota archaeon]
MDRSAIVLAGGFSSRFGQDKGVLELANKPLIKHVIDAVSPLVDETIVVTNSQERAEKYLKVIAADVQFVIDVCDSKSPLIGALTGFGSAHGEYSLLLPFDTPFVSREVVSLLFELCLTKAAVIPRWPNGQIEPLHAVYRTKAALEAAKIAVGEGELNVRAMIEKLRGVRYVSTLVIQQLDPDFRTFFNINTPFDLKKATAMVKHRKGK